MGVRASPLTWLIRAVWLTLPLTLGELISSALAGRSEAVATGAAVQAGALVTATTHQEIAAEWELDAGLVVEPDAPEQGARLRARFADALAAAGA